MFVCLFVCFGGRGRGSGERGLPSAIKIEFNPIKAVNSLMFPTDPNWCKVEQLDALKHNGMTNSEMEMCMWKHGCERNFVKSSWKQLSLKMGVYHAVHCVRSTGSAFYRNSLSIREDHAEADKNLLKW